MSKNTAEYVARDEAALEGAVELLLLFAEGRKKIMLNGGLGAGKTAFVKAFCRRLNVCDTVSSPTFALVNEYLAEPEGRQAERVYHLDLYRLKSIEEALDIGIEEYLDGPEFCLIEWPGVITPLVPDDAVMVNIEVMPDGARRLLFGFWAES